MLRKLKVCSLCPLLPSSILLQTKKEVAISLLREVKIFKLFEESMERRTAAQCRSHYQKLIKKFKTVPKLIKHN